MKWFRYRLALGFFLAGAGGAALACISLYFFDAGLPRFLAFILFTIALLGYSISRSRRLVIPLASSIEKFDRMISGESIERGPEVELTDLKRIRKAITLLVSEQQCAKGKLEELVRKLEESKKSLLESNAFLEALFESAPLGFMVVGTDGSYIRSNHRLIELMDWEDVAEVNIQTQFCRAFADSNRCIDLWEKGSRLPASAFEFEGTTACEESRRLHVFSAPVRDADGEIFARVWIIRDDSERHILNESLQQSQKMEAIGLLAGGIAHDFNNLLTAIRGNLELVLSDPELHLDEATTGRLEESFEATRTSSSLVSQILGYSRKKNFKMEPTCLNSVARATCKLVSRMMGAKIRIEAEIPSTTSRAMAEPTKIQQILVNLCVNARDAMPPEGGVITLSLDEVEFEESDCKNNRFRDRVPGKFVCLSVKDSGSGIKTEDLSRIFDPFFTTKPAGKGTGLGLSTCFGIAAQHSGWIECESKESVGTTFCVYFPFLDNKNPVDDATISGMRALNSVPEERDIGSILVVDDEDSLRRIANLSLKRKGYHVVEAESGPQALEFFQANADSVEMILLDRNMPDMSGEEVYRALMTIDPDVKVVICSGNLIDLTDFVTPEGHVPSGFLQKPYALNELIDVANETIFPEVVLAG